VDFLLVGIPAEVRYLGENPQKTGPLPALLKQWNLPHDNLLARVAGVPFDRVGGEPEVAGMFPKNHRLLTPGHDPLIGMIVGVFDILRGGRTAVDPSGIPQFDSGLAEPESNPLVAVTRWVLHLISDVATPMGLPAPGWANASSAGRQLWREPADGSRSSSFYVYDRL
jgi:hypothetical protein